MTEIERAAAPPRMRILVVDDSSLVRLYYRDALEKAGFEVEQAINGIEAMEKVLAQPFDLLIVDVNMPKMDGFSFLRALRRSAPDVATLPALVITTEAGEQDIARCQGRRREFLSRQAGLGSRPAAPCRGAGGSAAMNALQEQFVAEARDLIQQATDDLIAIERDGFARRADRARVSRLPHAQGLRGRGRSARDEPDPACRGRPAGRDPCGGSPRPRPSSTRRWPVSIRCRAGSTTSRPQAIAAARTPAKTRGRWPSGCATCFRNRPSAGDNRIEVPPQLPPAARCRNGSRAWLDRRRAMIFRQSRSVRRSCSRVSYEPHAGCFFDGDDPLQLMRQVPDLLASAHRGARAMAAARRPRSLLLQSSPAMPSRRRIATELADIFRLVPDQVRIVDVPAEALRLEQRVQGEQRHAPVSSARHRRATTDAARRRSGRRLCRPHRRRGAGRRQRAAPCSRTRWRSGSNARERWPRSHAETQAPAFRSRRDARIVGVRLRRTPMASARSGRASRPSTAAQIDAASRSLRVDEGEDRCAGQSRRRADRR